MAYRLAGGVTAACCGALALSYGRDRYMDKKSATLSAQSSATEVGKIQKPLPTRSEQIRSLKETSEFDILVIGGGATGCGVALDSVTRGLKTALVEKDDYSSGTSSRSTKLIHGGVRYLQKAIMQLDREQYHLVAEALHERANLLAIAPHLSSPLPIMLPVYKWWQVPYFWAGMKAYDLVSGRQLLKLSHFVGKKKTLELFPTLKKEKLCGAIIYYDGQQNDSRVNLAIGLTAIENGAVAANHCEVMSLLKKTVTEQDGSEKEVVCGAHMKDVITGEEFDVKAKCVINAAGPFTDTIRTMEDSEKRKICQPSSGVHIVLPEYYSPKNMGLLDPATSDGRVIFFLPWEGKTIAGTTDTPTDLSDNPLPQEKEIQFILDEVKHYFSPDVQVRRGDVLAAWSGIRPLVLDPNSKNTESVARNHIVEISDGKLLTIAGGKWTTYRSMAQDTVDAAVKHFDLKPENTCQTDGLMLRGGKGYTPNMFVKLVQEYGLEIEVAQHLTHTYGTKASEVAKMAALTGLRWPVVGQRLTHEFPYIEADVKYACKEYACTVVDVLARRLRIAFLDVKACQDIIPKVAEIMAKELNWTKEKQQKETETALTFLAGMGLKAYEDIRHAPINFTDSETEHYTGIFKRFDVNNKGSITTTELKKVLENLGENVSDHHLSEVIGEVAVKKSSAIELEEFLQLMSALNSGAVVNSRLGAIIDRHDHHLQNTTSV